MRLVIEREMHSLQSTGVCSYLFFVLFFILKYTHSVCMYVDNAPAHPDRTAPIMRMDVWGPLEASHDPSKHKIKYNIKVVRVEFQYLARKIGIGHGKNH